MKSMLLKSLLLKDSDHQASSLSVDDRSLHSSENNNFTKDALKYFGWSKASINPPRT